MNFREKEHELRSILTKGNNDVERLEKTTVTSIFYSISVRKERQLEKEIQDDLAAKLKYDAVASQKEHCCSRKESLINEQQELNIFHRLLFKEKPNQRLSS